MKKNLHGHLQDVLWKKLHVLQASFKEKQEALLSESKSTAGDKHETGRAMIQLEQEKLSTQLVQLRKQLETLHRINPDATVKKVQLGALVTTDDGHFYISIGLGQLDMAGQTYYCVAPLSPIGQAMLGKSVGDQFEFNGTTHQIIDIS